MIPKMDILIILSGIIEEFKKVSHSIRSAFNYSDIGKTDLGDFQESPPNKQMHSRTQKYKTGKSNVIYIATYKREMLN